MLAGSGCQRPQQLATSSGHAGSEVVRRTPRPKIMHCSRSARAGREQDDRAVDEEVPLDGADEACRRRRGSRLVEKELVGSRRHASSSPPPLPTCRQSNFKGGRRPFSRPISPPASHVRPNCPSAARPSRPPGSRIWQSSRDILSLRGRKGHSINFGLLCSFRGVKERRRIAPVLMSGPPWWGLPPQIGLYPRHDVGKDCPTHGWVLSQPSR